VLDRLELADGPAERPSRLGVLNGHVSAGGCPADGHGRGHQVCKPARVARSAAGDVTGRESDSFEDDLDARHGRIEVRPFPHRQAGGGGVEDHDVVSDDEGNRLHPRAAEDHRPASEATVLQREVAVETNAGDRAAGEQSLDKAVPRRGGRLLGENLGEDNNRQERTRRACSAEFLGDDGELHEPAAPASRVLGHVHAEPAERGGGRPEAWDRRTVTLEDRPRRPRRAGRCQAAPDDTRQLGLLLRQRDPHCEPLWLMSCL
jgi:hypothetical protein